MRLLLRRLGACLAALLAMTLLGSGAAGNQSRPAGDDLTLRSDAPRWASRLSTTVYVTFTAGWQMIMQRRGRGVPPTGRPLTSVPPGTGRVFNKDQSAWPQNNTSIAIDPTNINRIVGVYNDYRDPDRRGYSGWTVSRDGGASVDKDGLVPPITLIESEVGISRGNATVDVDSKGNFFLAGFHSEPSSHHPNGITVARSPKAGSPTGVFSAACSGNLDPDCWPTIKAVTANRCSPGSPPSSEGNFDDNPYVAVDDTGSPASGHVYVVWTRFPCSYTDMSSYIMIAKCDNVLGTCTPPLTLDSTLGTGSPLDFLQQPHIAIAPGGGVYVTWIRHSGSTMESEVARIMLRKIAPTSSLASVGTLNPLRTVHIEAKPIPWGSAPYPAYFRTATHPRVAVRENRVIIIWDRRTTADIVWARPNQLGWWFDYGTGASIVAKYSDDNGATWSGQQIVSGAQGPQYQPSICVDPTSGRVVVAYYSRQQDPLSARAQDVYAAISNTGAAPFALIRVTAVSNDTQAAPGSDFFIGDRLEVACRGSIAYVHFTANYEMKWFDDHFLRGYRGHYSYQQDNFVVRMAVP